MPDALRGGRLNPGRPGAFALGAVAVIAAVAAAVGAWAQRPVVEPAPDLPAASGVAHHEPLPAAPGRSGARHGGARPGGAGSASVDPADAAAAPAGQTAGALIVVSVIGRVARPGLVSLPNGARVADAVHASGDLLPGTDLHTLNLARRLIDGEQVDVGAPDPTAGVGGGGASAGSASGSGADAAGSGGASRPRARQRGRSAGGARVSLNLASIDQLLGISGVGPVTAQRIVDWRTQHGQFTSIDQLREVGGIGPAKFARLKDQVTL